MSRLLLPLLALSFVPHAIADEGSAARPNIIWVMADDLGYGDLGCYGGTVVATPNIDALAAGGMKFTDFYAGSTVCAPSRCVLMTGLHTGHCQIRGNADERTALEPGVVTVPEMLKNVGYRTGLFGKWGLSDEGTEGGPNEQGFDEFFGYLNQHHAHNYYPAYLFRNGERVNLPNVVPGNGPFGTGVASKKVVYSADLIQDEALAFIEENKAEPFFLYYAATLPHANNEARRNVRDGAEVTGGAEPDYGPYAEVDWDEPTKGHAAMIDLLDRQVGEIVDKLDELGLTESTVLCFTSDNGPHAESGHDPQFFRASGPLRGLKRTLTEGGIRVPMIASWPGHVLPGTESDHVGYFGDLFATAADLSGGTAPYGLDSLSFAPTLLPTGRYGTQAAHPFLYWEFYEQGGKQAVRAGRWKAVFRPIGSTTPALYDLAGDVGETTDVAADHPDVVADLTAIAAREHVPDPAWTPRGRVNDPTGE